MLTLSCPIDGLVMTSTETAKGDVETIASGKTIGKHLHFDVAALACLNGHEWSVGFLQLQRTK